MTVEAMRQLPPGKDENMRAEEPTQLGAVTQQWLVRQTEKVSAINTCSKDL